MTTYHPLTPITNQRDVYGQPVTALSFDPVADILWSGSHSGSIIAYYGARGMRGVSFPVGGDIAVEKICVGEGDVRAHGVNSQMVGSWAKGGANAWCYRASSPDTVTTFSNIGINSSLVAIATSASELLLVSSSSGKVIRQTTTPSLITHLQSSHTYLLAGSSDGSLRVHDPRTGARRDEGSESHVRAHAGGLQGLQSNGNYMFTIGWGMGHSQPILDPLVKVYDIRSMRPLPPVPFSDGPAFVNILPKRPSSLVITSNQGLINIVDVTNPNASEFYQLDTTAYISSAAASPTGAYMAFGDTSGTIHMMTSVEDDERGYLPFNGFDGVPVDWADTPESLPDIEWTDTTPLNSIGMPYYDNLLLSTWEDQYVSTSLSYPPPMKIHPLVLSTMKMNDNVAYASLPRELRGRRNMIKVGRRRDQGRFRSGNSRIKEPEPETPTFDYDDEIPRIYRRVEIEYSKFGVEDFDFGFYNRTDYSGLETHILNSYTNPMLQVMHYCLPIRRLAKSHITTNCPREHCLLCELGFVVCMLADAHGTNCQSSNFCKTVGVLAQSQNAIELVDYGREPADVNYAHMIQSFHRFLIDHLSLEGNAFPYNPLLVQQISYRSNTPTPAAAPITQLLGLDAKTIITCMSCRAVREKESMTHIVDMVYPRAATGTGPSSPNDFEGILRHSLIRQLAHKATCQTCKQFSNFTSQRSIPTRDLPPLLAINASAYNEETIKFWLDVREKPFLKPRIELRGQVEGDDEPDIAIYELRAIILQIVTKQRSHLVATVKIPEAEGGRDSTSPWFLFNDFSVKNISENEALSIPDKWKVPAIVYLERVDMQDSLDFSGLPVEMDPSVLSRDTSISLNRDKNLIKHECLRFEELPTPGTLVAIDAEFVSMQQEEMEYRSDGTNRVLRPARLSLARVSVLRGDGPQQGVPFIDDHIHTSEAIVDYLTEFSGIKFGDLDPHLSRYTLTPLKLVYKKLRLLVDRRCIFIGHGLSKDFRIINIFVPPDQVIDTVDLYFLKARQRRLSLRFLSWFFLNESIQIDVHDSIEDARSALKLYKAYHEFEEQGTFDEKLEELYREGRQYNWRPPPNTQQSPTQAGATTPRLANAPVPIIPSFALGRNLLQSTFVGAAYPGSHSANPLPNFFTSTAPVFGWSMPPPRGQR